MLGGGGFFPDIKKKGQENFLLENQFKRKFKTFFPDKFMLQHGLNPFFRSIYVNFWFRTFFLVPLFLPKNVRNYFCFYFANLGVPLCPPPPSERAWVTEIDNHTI